MKTDGSSPAFPTPVIEENPNGHYNQVGMLNGMSLRDYFAASALQGLLGNVQALAGMDEESIAERKLTVLEIAARDSYEYADAMLKERCSRTT